MKLIFFPFSNEKKGTKRNNRMIKLETITWILPKNEKKWLETTATLLTERKMVSLFLIFIWCEVEFIVFHCNSLHSFNSNANHPNLQSTERNRCDLNELIKIGSTPTQNYIFVIYNLHRKLFVILFECRYLENKLIVLLIVPIV